MDWTVNADAWEKLIVWQEQTGGHFTITVDGASVSVHLTAGMQVIQHGIKGSEMFSQMGQAADLREAANFVLDSWEECMSRNSDWTPFNPERIHNEERGWVS